MADFGATGELLALGIGAARQGDQAQARFYLEWLLRDQPTETQAADAWCWLARIAPDAAEQRRCLERALVLAPFHPEARRDLAILDGRLKVEEVIDHRHPTPPRIPGGPIPPQEVSRPRCPSCGGALLATAGQRGMRCQFCGYQGHAGSAHERVQEQDWVAAVYTARGHRWVLPTESVLSCQGCGALLTLPPGRISAGCPYCGAAQIVRASATPELIAPEGITPFTLNADDALRRARDWLATRPFSPGTLAERAAIGVPRPLYLPCWTFDVEGSIHWHGTVEEASYGGIGVGPLRLRPHYREAPVSGIDPVFFDDLLVAATPSVPADLFAGLRFDTGALVPYSADLLAGWPAELYRVPVADASLAAREQAIARHREQAPVRSDRDIRDFTIGAVELTISAFKLVLLPIWIATYRYGDHPYPLLVNGRSGTAAGEVPRSRVGGLLADLLAPLTTKD